MEVITTQAAAAPAGHYSQAIAHGEWVFVSGQLPVTAAGPLPTDAPFAEQARVVLTNIAQILKASGSDLSLIVKSSVYIADIDLWPQFNAIYAQMLGEHRPARSVIPVPRLHYGYQLEMDVIALRHG